MATWNYDDIQVTSDSAGNVVPGVQMWVYTTKTGSTRLTSTIRDGDGNAVTDGTIVSDSNGYHPFQDTSSSNFAVLWRQPLSGGVPSGRRFPVKALEAAGGGSSLDTSVPNTWTGAQAFNGGISIPNDTLTISDTNGLQAALDAAADPVFRGTVANQTAMLALSAGLDDWCYRSDTASVWRLLRGSDPTTLANWVNLSGGSASVDYSTLPAGMTVDHTGPSTDARPTSRTDIPVRWWTTDGVFPANAISGDVWVNALVVAPS